MTQVLAPDGMDTGKAQVLPGASSGISAGGLFVRSLQAKFILPVAVVVVLATLVAATLLALVAGRDIKQSALHDSRESLNHIEGILSVTDALMMERVQSSMRLLMQRGAEIGVPRQGEWVDLNGQRAPDLVFGQQPQARRFDLVDHVISSQGGTATLFSRQGDDFVRISTNVRHEERRAVGTRLDPQGKAIAAIRQGRAYYGQVDILGVPYIAGYEPMLDADGQLIGIWYVGYPVNMQALQTAFAKTRILEGGFIALLDEKGQISFHSDHVAPDFVTRIATSPDPGWVVDRRAFAPWGFHLLAAHHEDEVGQAVRQSAISVVAGGLVLCAVLVGLLFWLARSLVIAPLRSAVAFADEIASGNLTHAVAVRREDEIGTLLKALNHMREALQRIDRMKSDFLSTVSHELRTPLTSIRGFASLIEREFGRSFALQAGADAALRKKSDRIQENLKIILKESERLTRLINDVLDLAKIEAGRIEWHDTAICPATLAHDAADAVRGMFEARPAVALQLEIQPDLPFFVGDADRLLQVLVNLLNNAGKFTEQGSVLLRLVLDDACHLRIEIRDTGVGFPPEDAEAIFDKFQQARHGDTLQDRPKGTGLGLTISREIVERHGGCIRATSVPGEGSTFYIVLPLAVQAGAEQNGSQRSSI